MAAYWEIAVHSAYEMFSLYKFLSVILVFSHPRFMGWEFLSDCTNHCLFVHFCNVLSFPPGVWFGILNNFKFGILDYLIVSIPGLSTLTLLKLANGLS